MNLAQSSNISCRDTAKSIKAYGRRSNYPAYLQWFHYCEGMVMPPINTIGMQTILLPPERRDEGVLAQAKKLLSKSVAPTNESLIGEVFLLVNFLGRI